MKRGPAFGASKKAPPKHKYLESTGRMSEAQAEFERDKLVGKKRLHRQQDDDDEDDEVAETSRSKLLPPGENINIDDLDVDDLI